MKAKCERSSAKSGEKGERIGLRAFSALILGGGTLWTLYLGTWPFGCFVGLIAIVMSWEWNRILGGKIFDVSFIIHALSVVGGLILFLSLSSPFWGLTAICIGAQLLEVMTIYWKKRPDLEFKKSFSGLGVLYLGLVVLWFARSELPDLFFLFAFQILLVFVFVVRLSGVIASKENLPGLGVLYVGLPALLLVWLRSDLGWYGFLAVLLLLCVVWVSDTFAFLGGRAIGGPLLSPAVSPKKTWAGVVCGLLGGAAVSALFYATLLNQGNPIYLVTLGVLLSALAQFGDLAESALKRSFEVKNSSVLLPGHGGFMDRMDGLVFASIGVGVWVMALDPLSPARALLFGVWYQ